MARDGAGNYSLPQPPFTPNSTISSTAVNSDFSDIATALTGSLARNGEAAATGSQPMAGFRHTGVGNAQARTDYAATGQVQDGSLIYGGTTGGTATAITATVTPGIPAYVTGMTLVVKVGTSCGDAPTLNINSIAAKKIYVPTLSGPLQATSGDLVANNEAALIYDAALDSATGGFMVAGPTQGWRPASAAVTVSGSPVSQLDFAIPSWATLIRVEFSASASGGAAPLAARISQDSGASYLSSAAEYGGVVTDFRDTGVSSGGMTSGYLALSTGFAAGVAVDGYITMRRAIGAPCDIASWGIDSTPARVRRVAYGGSGTIAPTNLRFFFSGQSLAVGSTFTMFAR